MLRIEIQKEPTTIRLILEGKLKGPWAAEFERCWLAEQAAKPEMTLEVDLTGVDFIDDQGKAVLARMRANGARLIANCLISQAAIQKIEDDIQKEPRS